MGTVSTMFTIFASGFGFYRYGSDWWTFSSCPSRPQHFFQAIKLDCFTFPMHLDKWKFIILAIKAPHGKVWIMYPTIVSIKEKERRILVQTPAKFHKKIKNENNLARQSLKKDPCPTNVLRLTTAQDFTISKLAK